MSKHKENDFVIPTLFLLYENPKGLPMDQIKDKISEYIKLNDEDLKPYPSRHEDEPGYYQILGNMISHRNENLFKYVDRIEIVKADGKKGRTVYRLNDDGKAYIEELLNQGPVDESGENSSNEESLEPPPSIDAFDQKRIEEVNDKGFESKPKRDGSIAKKVLELSGYQCQYAMLVHEKHVMFTNERGKPYVEAHHLIPMKAAVDFVPKNLDRPSNIVCLCPNCHALLHHGSKEEKAKILRVLYDHYIGILNEEGVYISFEELLNKYY